MIISIFQKYELSLGSDNQVFRENCRIFRQYYSTKSTFCAEFLPIFSVFGIELFVVIVMLYCIALRFKS